MHLALMRRITAVIVTKGDVDLEPILATLPYDRVEVWDNSKTVLDAKTFGRWLAAERIPAELFYFQDDDVLFTEHERLLREHEETGQMATLNMPSPWYERVQTSWEPVGRPLGMFGAGCIVPRYLMKGAFAPYLRHFHSDDLFLELCDLVGGTFMPWRRVDLGYEILPQASYGDRIATSPGHSERRLEMRRRVAALVAQEAGRPRAQLVS